MIPYGADDSFANQKCFLGSASGLGRSIVIARPEPENSFLEMVSAFSRKRRGHHLVVLGKFAPESNEYHAKVKAASDEVNGKIYDAGVVGALRYYSAYYLHGHTAGIQTLAGRSDGAGCVVIAHKNKFSVWVAGNGAAFFSDADECAHVFDALIGDSAAMEMMKAASPARFRAGFQWPAILGQQRDSASEQLIA